LNINALTKIIVKQDSLWRMWAAAHFNCDAMMFDFAVATTAAFARSGAKRLTIPAVCMLQMGKVEANAPFTFGLTTIDLASALLTKCNSLPTPRFRPTCGRKMSDACGDRHGKRDRLNNTNNN
jgi:hypothetical protein